MIDGYVFKQDFCPMAPGNFLHDGKPQAASGFSGAKYSEETLEYALTVFYWNAGAIILDSQFRHVSIHEADGDGQLEQHRAGAKQPGQSEFIRFGLKPDTDDQPAGRAEWLDRHYDHGQ